MTEISRNCPLDGEPLLSIRWTRDKPTLYVHNDGTWHYDKTVEMEDRRIDPPHWSTLSEEDKAAYDPPYLGPPISAWSPMPHELFE